MTIAARWEKNLAVEVPVEVDLSLLANYETGRFEVSPADPGDGTHLASNVGVLSNRSDGALKVVCVGEVLVEEGEPSQPDGTLGAQAQQRAANRLEMFGSEANVAQVSLELTPEVPADDGSAPLPSAPGEGGAAALPDARTLVPLGGRVELADTAQDADGNVYPYGWVVPAPAAGAVGQLKVVYGLDLGSLPLSAVKVGMERTPIAKLFYTVGLVDEG